MSPSFRTIRSLNTLLLAGSILGALSSPSLTASAADIQASSTFNLIETPPVTLTDAQPIQFGQRNIPRQGTATYEINPIRNKNTGAGRVTFNNANPRHLYSWQFTDPVCPANVSLTLSQAYNDSRAAGLIVPERSNELYFGGTLSVNAAATPGVGACTFNISFVRFGDVPL